VARVPRVARGGAGGVGAAGGASGHGRRRWCGLALVARAPQVVRMARVARAPQGCRWRGVVRAAAGRRGRCGSPPVRRIGYGLALKVDWGGVLPAVTTQFHPDQAHEPGGHCPAQRSVAAVGAA